MYGNHIYANKINMYMYRKHIHTDGDVYNCKILAIGMDKSENNMTSLLKGMCS